MVRQISTNELQAKLQEQGENFLLLDVREPFEYEYARIKDSKLIPLGQLGQRITELNPEMEVVVICHHGIRSQQAAEFLVFQGFAKVLNLTGGIDAWSVECDAGVPRY